MACLIALCLFLLASGCYGQGNGEVEVALSQSGLNYAAGVAVDVLSRDLLNQRLPDATGNPSLTNIRTTEFTKPTAQVQLVAGAGVTLTLRDGFLKVEADWNWERRFWYKIRDSGSVNASSKASISLSVRVERSNGRPTINAHSCSASLSDLNVRVGGSWTSFIYNWIFSLFSGRFKSFLESKMCEVALSAINDKGNAELGTLNLQARVNSILTIDYSLARDPYFNRSFFISYHKGTFVNDSSTFQTPAMNTPTDKMIGVSISENVLNSAARVAYNAGVARYTFTINNWQDLVQELPFIQKQTRGPFELSIYANSAPTVSISSSGIRVNVSAGADLVARPQGRPKRTLMNASFVILAEASAYLNSSRLIGNVPGISLSVKWINPSFPGVSTETLNSGLSTLVSKVLSQINEKLQEGLPIPSLAGVVLTDASVAFASRHLSVSANVRYSG